MMPSIDHCLTTNPAEMTTLTKTLEVFETYKHREEKDSDEESFHLPLDDDESETTSTKTGGNETEEDILNKFDENAKAIEEEKETVSGVEKNEEGEKNSDEPKEESKEETFKCPEGVKDKGEEVAKDKVEENSNDSKQNEDAEDLFDISIIRDAEEDNAESEYNAAHPEEEDEERSEGKSDKGSHDEEEEEMDVDKQELKDDVDIDESKDLEESKTDDVEIEETKLDKEDAEDNKKSEMQLDEVTGLMTNGKEEQTEERSCLKRSLDETDEEAAAKKTRIDESEKPKLPLTTLLSLQDFMNVKKHNKRLTMHDLEEFCVQKICEVIVYKSELGEVHHQLKQQDQLIESMRKELQNLTKQARDLEIVNKKLMNELKQRPSEKTLLPLKITRSVGLQVKFIPYDAGVKKKAAVAAPKAPSAATPRRTVAKQKQSTVGRPPLLSQALQNRKPPTPQPTPKKSSSVIDLTDEDDKRDKSKSPNKIVPLRTTPLRLATTQTKSVVTSSGPQVMYVVQSAGQNVLTSPLGQKAVVVNFQPTNGVLASALNGSAVSVIPKAGNTIQLKQLPAPAKAVPNGGKAKSKHPAPLPPPPLVRVSSDKGLKLIPPKPHLTIRKTDTGIILQWKMPYDLDLYETIASYQLYAYQETSALPSTDMWRKVGDVKALALPMACTLTQFADKNKYYFAVRPVDVHKRIGMFSEPEEISL